MGVDRNWPPARPMLRRSPDRVWAEFPELQGAMGLEMYALLQGEKPEVMPAIEEHYKTASPSDNACRLLQGVRVAVLALTDKLDTLVGFWAIDESQRVQGSLCAATRGGAGCSRLILENDLRLSLRTDPGMPTARYR